MRTSSLAAGLELRPATSPPVLLRRKAAKLADKPRPAALATLARAYLTVLGPATPTHVASYYDVRRADLESAWPDDLVEVRVDKTAAWLPAECVDDFENAPEPELVRLLGGFDPYLQARDRDLIVPDKVTQKALWPVLGRPGAVFVDGEVLGTWRAKTSGKKLTITLDEFAPVPKDRIEAEAERVAEVRGLTLDRVK
jgi:hypothetical protein